LTRIPLTSHALMALTGLALLLLGGCASLAPARDPAYAATRPPHEPSPPAANGAIYQAGYETPLFEDIRARRVGDVLTIKLVEKTDASKKASTNLNKKNAIDLPNPTILGRPVAFGGATLATSVDTKQDFAGAGDSSQSNSLSGLISVTVAEVLPNDNLMVRGQKVMRLNQGDEYVRIQGIVRPVDISPDNTVLSTNVADVQIAYGGTGAVADSNTMGWLGRFFLSVLWPF
jgi:flagellar L-ring protein precursor FlgH